MPQPRQPSTLREQLSPLVAKLRATRAAIRPVSQVVIRLKPVARTNRFAETVKAVLRWMDNRAGRRLPKAAWDLQSFELSEVGAQRAAAVALPEGKYWAGRLDDADKKVPLRTWVTEVGVGEEAGGDVLFGVRLICAMRGEESPFERTVPGFVRSIVESGPAELDGLPVGTVQPRVVATEADVDGLVNLLESPSRRAPVAVLALPDRCEDPLQTAIPASDVVKRVLGAAHIVVITARASFMLTDRMGKELSVFRQAVRIYRPGFSRLKDQQWRHPLWLPGRIEQWEGAASAADGKAAFARSLIDELLAATVQRSDREEELPAFTTVRQLAAQAERERLIRSGSTAADLVALYEEDNRKLREELQDQREEYDSLLSTAEAERDQALQQAQEARSRASANLARIHALEKRLVALGDKAAATPIPATLDGFETWVREHLSGAVEIHNRAFRGIKKSVYEDPSLIYRALLLLRDWYVPMRREGGAERRAAYEKARQDLKLDDQPVGEAVKTHADQYTVDYDGRPRVLDRHLKKGVAHDEKRSFRLYYFWDDESQCVVVGWLPSHLDNSLT